MISIVMGIMGVDFVANHGWRLGVGNRLFRGRGREMLSLSLVIALIQGLSTTILVSAFKLLVLRPWIAT